MCQKADGVVICQNEAEKRIIKQFRELTQRQGRQRPFTLIIENNGSVTRLSKAVNVGMVKE